MAALMVAVAGCTPSGPGAVPAPDHPGSPSAAPAVPPEPTPSPAISAPATSAPAGDTPSAADVLAPFDPCSTVGWADFPASVRPTDISNQPTLMTVGPPDAFRTGCRYNNSEAVRITVCRPPPCQDEASTRDVGDLFLANVVWGEMSLDPARFPSGTSEVSIAGRKGLVTRRRNTANGKNDPQCIVTFQLARGVAGVAVTDGRFGTSPCAVARTLADTIAQRAR
jgi:hypothetical protein